MKFDSNVAVFDNKLNRVFEAEYDAWGKQTVIKDDICFNHGFTGHEMLFRSDLIHKSKLTWEAFKFSRDRLGYRFKTKNSDIYRKVVPQKLSYASKVLGRVTIMVNVFENLYNGVQNQRVGLGNITDLGVTVASVYGGLYGFVGGLIYLGSDYMTYKYTGKDIREHLNLKHSVNW